MPEISYTFLRNKHTKQGRISTWTREQPGTTRKEKMVGDYTEHLISMAGGDGDEPTETVKNETYNYGRLWSDGTFSRVGWSDEKLARREFEEKGYELKNVPNALRPVFARQRVVTTKEIYAAEALPEPKP